MTPRPRTKTDPTTPTTLSGAPDMRLSESRHDPVLVVAQQLEDAIIEIFKETGQTDLARLQEELEGEFPGGIEGQTTGRPDMRLAPTRHDPKLVAMQQVLDRARNVRRQIAINKGLIEGESASLPSLREIFDSEFLDADDLAGVVSERVPKYETIYQAHKKYDISSASGASEEPPARARTLASPGRRKSA